MTSAPVIYRRDLDRIQHEAGQVDLEKSERELREAQRVRYAEIQVEREEAAAAQRVILAVELPKIQSAYLAARNELELALPAIIELAETHHTLRAAYLQVQTEAMNREVPDIDPRIPPIDLEPFDRLHALARQY